MKHPATYGFAVAACTAALVLSACSGSDKPKQSASPASPGSSSSASSSGGNGTGGTGKPNPNPGPAEPTKNPLTGGKPSKNGVVAVKIDDTASGRPQVNINQADIVYIEQVEAGLSRLLAVYNDHLPTVEAVRSTRAPDPELVAQYGHVAYVASGGAYNPLKVLDASPLKTSINDRGGPGFHRDPYRYPPYNLRADLAEVAAKLKAPRARPVGFHWAWDSSQLKGKAPGLHVRTVVGSTPVAFDYDPRTNHYNRLINGVVQKTAGGKTIAASDVLVQFCSVTTYYKNIDVNGNPSKYTHTIGHGRAVMFRGGKRVSGTWYRKYYNGGTQFRTAAGADMVFRPGQVWVVLVANNAPLG